MRLRIALAVSLGLLSLPVFAAPKTCLVLAGGGARGMAHVGVLRVLERERIPVDCVVGTSMGAVVGSLYASGVSAEALEKTVRELDWKSMFDDSGDRTQYAIRRKQEDRAILAKAALGFRDGKAAIPPGLFRGQQLGLTLRALLLPVASTTQFDELPTQFRAVGTDLETGDKVVMGDGDLVTAVRASMSVPAAFPPVERDGRMLIDGGVADNLPVDVARALGAERVIAVDISSPLKTREALNNPLDITDQMITALMQRETQKQRESLGPNDLLLTPELGTMSSMDFSGAVDPGIKAGTAAAEAALPQLRRFAVDAAAYTAWMQQRRDRIVPLGPVEDVRVANKSRMADESVRALLSEHTGKPFARAAVEADISRLYGTGEFSTIDYTLTHSGLSPDDVAADGSVLTLRTKGRDWERQGALQMGLKLEDDFNGSSNFQLLARWTRRELNRLGGEWLVEGQIGKINRLASEWHQPLDMHRRWFVRPHAEWYARNHPIYTSFGDRLVESVEYRRKASEFNTAIGVNAGNWGEFALEPFIRRSRYSLLAGSAPEASSSYVTSGGVQAQAYIDTQDDAEFPRTGWLLEARYARYLPSMQSDLDLHAASVNVARAFSIDDARFMASLRGRYASEISGEELAFLGGFLNLSGFPEDALAGRRSTFGSLRYYHPVFGVGKYPLFVGASAEAGSIRDPANGGVADQLIFAGSVFAGASTPIGPVYFAYGQAEEGQRALYFFIGRPY